MSLATLDTHEVVKDLRSAGFTDAQAEAVARNKAQDLDLSTLATKVDVEKVRTDLTASLAEAKVEMINWVFGAIGLQTDHPRRDRRPREVPEAVSNGRLSGNAPMARFHVDVPRQGPAFLSRYPSAGPLVGVPDTPRRQRPERRGDGHGKRRRLSYLDYGKAAGKTPPEKDAS